MLSAVPDNWEAVLVDNPGFLDTDEQVKMIPEAAIMCSSVVVMVISCDNLSMDVTMSAYKKIKERDPSNFFHTSSQVTLFRAYSCGFPRIQFCMATCTCQLFGSLVCLYSCIV